MATPKPEFVSKKDFNEFQEQMLGILERMAPKAAEPAAAAEMIVDSAAGGQGGGMPGGGGAMLITQVPTVVPPAARIIPQVIAKTIVTPVATVMSDDFAGPNGALPPQYQRMFEKFFDPADGFEGRLNFPEIDEKGRETGGLTFTIIVPDKFSNMNDGYKKMYKHDLRTKALMPHNMAQGIQTWCEMVAKNLRYNKNLQTK